MRWVDAWNDVYDIIRGRREVPCMLPDWSIVSVDECLGWLQQSVYEGYLVGVEEGWVGHCRGVIARRRQPDAEQVATDVKDEKAVSEKTVSGADITNKKIDNIGS